MFYDNISCLNNPKSNRELNFQNRFTSALQRTFD